MVRWYAIPALWLACAAVAQAQLPGAVFQQDPLADGVVSIEAEHYQGIAAGSQTQNWELISASQFSGGQAMQALPNIGKSFNTGFAANSPRLDYQVNFDRAGVHYIVARGIGDSGSDDSIHAGIGGAENTTADRITGFNRSSPYWSGTTLDRIGGTGDLERAWFDVPSAGEHTVNIWMREDGIAIDKFILTTNPDFVPDGLGPAENENGVGGGGVVVDPDAMQIVGLSLANGMVVGSVMPAPAVDTYQLLEATGLGASWTPDAQSTFSGYDFDTPAPTGDWRFYGVETTQVDSNRQMAALVLNRLAYGPTPAELARVLSIGADAYIQEQLAPELITESADADPLVQQFGGAMDVQFGRLSELRSWYQLRALEADRQLLEVMSQFINNHFVTYFYKTRNWYDDEGFDRYARERLAAHDEYEEMRKWRQVLMDPNGTFYDLLKVSIESPAMIIYLDTYVNEKTDPNENYARELLELFTQGVDNGYDQDDIEEMAKVWTGWRVGPVRYQDVGDPLATLYSNETQYISMEDPGWLYRKGTSEPAAGWNDTGFVTDTSWLAGTTSIGFGDSDDQTVLTDMQGNYSTLYLRHTFSVADASQVDALKVRLYVDDGCVAWVNGQEVGRVSVPDGSLPYTGTGYSHEANRWEEFVIENPASILHTGANNVLAIQALNQSLNSSDFSIDAELSHPPAWAFVFDANDHDPSNKVVFAGKVVNPRFGPPWGGQSYELVLPERLGNAGIDDGYDVIAHLANLPYTMEYLSVKLCRWFVNEDFNFGSYYNVSDISEEAQLIRDCMVAWDTPAGDGRKGNLRSVLGTIFASDLFRSQAAMQQKVKSPGEFVHSAMRALKVDLAGGGSTVTTDGWDLSRPMERMGMAFFTRSQPDGYPEEGHEWIDTGTVTERLRFIQHLMMNPSNSEKTIDYGGSGDDNVCDPVALIQDQLPSAQWNDAAAVTDYLLGLVYPGEGVANLALDRAECIQLLNADATGVPDSSPFLTLTDPTEYDLRVRSLAGLILANPKFHEQ